MPRKKDRWPELCKMVSKVDGLPTREAGSWTEDKLYYWNKYLEITTSAMVGKPFWSAVVYVDLFAGPGVLHLRKTGKRIPGSALLAASTPKPFDRLLLCEKDPQTAAACESRLASLGAADRSTVFVGDCNRVIGELAAEIPRRSLTVAFIDPEGLHANFSTIQVLAQDRRVDLLILFADRMDAFRNVNLYRGQEKSNLDTFLGEGCDWRAAYGQLPNHGDATAVCQMFEKLLCDQLRSVLGYSVFTTKVMRTHRSPIYRVIYASKSDRGLDFWNKIDKSDPQGQRGLFEK